MLKGGIDMLVLTTQIFVEAGTGAQQNEASKNNCRRETTITKKKYVAMTNRLSTFVKEFENCSQFEYLCGIAHNLQLLTLYYVLFFVLIFMFKIFLILTTKKKK